MIRPPLPPSHALSERNLKEKDSEDDATSSEDESTCGAAGRYQPPRPSMVPARRRRRSSVSHRLSVASTANVNELYQKAIRLNAENKINLANSWNLKLIEHMDQVLEEEDESTTNFTKASCTLDASVKIYGYRVDDVHLTSYKVLANLNRSENNKKRRDGPAEGDEGQEEEGDEDSADKAPKRNPQRKLQRGNTLEEQASNINLSNLDSVYDIDPLFHKMSGAFDEGGAKGLLLVNLAMGDACNIVFDSRTEPEDTGDASASDDSAEVIDIQNLRQKLEAHLDGDDLFDLPLVPQLSSLRGEHGNLVEAGYCEAAVMNTVGPKTPGRRRYKASNSDEAVADRSIHEQVRGRLPFTDGEDDDGEIMHETPQGVVTDTTQSPGVVDFGTDYDFGGDDDHDDVAFDNFIANPRFSEEPEPSHGQTHLIDAIASGQAQLSTDEFVFFTDTNQWAGAGHWKKSQRTTKKKETKKITKTTKSKKEKFALISFDKVHDVSKFLKAPKTSTTWTKTTLKKNTKEDHVLPIDSNITVEHLTKLFLRPDYTPKPREEQHTGNDDEKRVSFGFATAWDDGSMGGGDDDGPGFDFDGPDTSSDDQDFLFDDLDGIRKVQRIKVGYASVAKKVDVKKLKHDLWTELEDRITRSDVDDMDEEEPKEHDTSTCNAEPFSFHDVLKTMEDKKSQPDITLPFYFICALHLANEKGLVLKSEGLNDFTIALDHSLNRDAEE